MPCPRCHGLMCIERPYSFFAWWRCLNCGNYHDRRIELNRLPGRARRHLDDARARAEALFDQP